VWIPLMALLSFATHLPFNFACSLNLLLLRGRRRSSAALKAKSAQ